jgi:uncharacterized protein YbjT (DUF2867 family)
MFVVLGASGNTGKVVAETLLGQKKKVRVVLHDAAKGRVWREAGADVAVANVDDGATLERAFSGAEGVYVLHTNVVVWEGGHLFWRGETDLQTVLSTLLGR